MTRAAPAGGTEASAAGPAGTSALSTQDLSVTVGGVRILREVSLSVRADEITVLLGPNGAGKTTLFNVLTGLRSPSSGRVLLGDRDITGTPAHRRARLGLARGFQVTSLFPRLTALENVRLACQAHRGGSLAIWRRVGRKDPALAEARSILDTVGIGDKADREAAALSHGDKRKLDLAIAIAGSPSVLLLDEPTAGMSAENVPELTAVIASVREATGAAVLLIEHRMDVAVALADRMAVMHHGELLACDTPESVMADPLVQSAYLGSTV